MKTRLLIALSFAALTSTACGVSLTDGEPGFIPLAPYKHEQMGVQSVAPVEWAQADAGVFARQAYSNDNTAYIVLGFPGKKAEDVVPLILEQSGLERMPPSIGTERSPALEWALYEAQITVVGLGEVQGKIAIAQDDSGAYLIVVQAWREDFEANRAMLETLFRYGLYNTRKLEIH